MNINVTPLPATRDELVARKTMKRGPSLNDDVDRIHVVLWEDPIYKGFHEAVFDSDAVEGSLAADNFKAAEMIREYAKEHKDFYYVSKKNLTTLVKSMNVVLRRYHMSRHERAMTVGGETVSNGNTSE